jgi:hypothetical protein
MVRKVGCLNAHFQGTLLEEKTICMAPQMSARQREGSKSLPEEETACQRHQNREHLGENKPLQKIQSGDSKEEEREMSLRFMENLEGSKEK